MSLSALFKFRYIIHRIAKTETLMFSGGVLLFYICPGAVLVSRTVKTLMFSGGVLVVLAVLV
ncbi:MAG: hypothetical protein IPP97_27425 [Candidatus Obscuribacter sp.]|nr:hypothetical protein [Candidatus Obscuribacter sp.]